MNLDCFYYCTERGNYRTFENVMSDIRRFLASHPTETVILNIKAEYDDGKRYNDTIENDINKIDTYEIGDTATVLGNTGNFLRIGGSFIGWNTEADGSGAAYSAGDTIPLKGSVTLYAQWGAARVTTRDGVSADYREFKDALSAWGDGSTLTLLGDVETDENIYIRGIHQILDLNGYGITRVQRHNQDMCTGCTV